MKAKNPHAVALGLLGGAKGGKQRARNLSKAERSAQARYAATMRWAAHNARKLARQIREQG